MSRSTNVRGKGKVIVHVRDLLIKQYGSEARINVSEVQRGVGLNAGTVNSWLDGTVTRFDAECIIAWAFYFGTSDIAEIIEYVPPRNRKGEPDATEQLSAIPD